MSIKMFCVFNHDGPVISESNNVHQDLEKNVPKGWRLVKASMNKETFEWYYDPISPLEVWVCPKHTLKGEPGNN